MKDISILRFLWLLLFASLSVAWPWSGPGDAVDGLILGRADTQSSALISEFAPGDAPTGTTNTNPESAKETAAASGDSAAATTGDGNKATNGGSTATKGVSGHSNATQTHATKTSAIDPRLPPGGIEMVTPAPLAGPQYYKVGDFVTFGWNYTSLLVTPTAINVLASCSINSQLYTIALNQSVEPTGAVTWDTGEYQATASIPLLVASYTLVVYDADEEITATPQAGYLDTQDQYVFGMYTPQAYTPLNEFKCSTCSGALSLNERQALAFMLWMGTVTVLSFTWFAGGFGLFS